LRSAPRAGRAPQHLGQPNQLHLLLHASSLPIALPRGRRLISLGFRPMTRHCPTLAARIAGHGRVPDERNQRLEDRHCIRTIAPRSPSSATTYHRGASASAVAVPAERPNVILRVRLFDGWRHRPHFGELWRRPPHRFGSNRPIRRVHAGRALDARAAAASSSATVYAPPDLGPSHASAKPWHDRAGISPLACARSILSRSHSRVCISLRHAPALAAAALAAIRHLQRQPASTHGFTQHCAPRR